MRYYNDPMGPATSGQRLEIIDAIRGFALFGILAANMRAFHSPAEVFYSPIAMWNTPLDRVAETIIDTLFGWKFLTIFSVLFGLGFAIQMERAEARGVRFLSCYSRRLVVLLALGLIHGLLIWMGDILATYAVLGFLLLLFRNRKPQTILIWAGAIHLVLVMLPVVGVVMASMGVESPAPPLPEPNAIAESIRINAQGSWSEIQHLRMHNWLSMNGGILFTLLWVLPRFLFGMWLWRSGFVRELETRTELLRRWMCWGIPFGIAGNLAAALLVQAYDRGSMIELRVFASQVLFRVWIPVLSCGYAAAVALFTMSRSRNWLGRGFAAVGRTALSNYLLQSAVCTAIFDSWGFGLFGKVSPMLGFVPTFLIYGTQLPLSIWWLKRFQFGPLEWVWRGLTYWKRPRWAAT
jgi:uncharacterized protein